MSTRSDGSSGPPEELRLGLGLLPTSGAIPSQDAPTPGLALAAARVPGGPTLPDPDPFSMVGLVARLANELFLPSSAPSVPSTALANPGADLTPEALVLPAESPVPTSSVPATPQAPTNPPVGAAPGSAVVPTTMRSEPTSPFDAPLRFETLGDFGTAPIGGFPLLDAPVVATEPGHPQSTKAPTTPTPTDPTYEIVADTGLGLTPSRGVFDPHALRREFPILNERVNGKRLVWLDNAATTQKPQTVIDRLSYFYEHENSNIHRAAHTLAARATDAYEGARQSVRRFIGAGSTDEIVFVRGTTEGINLIAQSWGRRNIKEGDEIVITWLEHHANIVPWQMLCAEKGARLRVAPVDDRGAIIVEEYEKLLNPKTRLVSMTQVSNALGTITPAREMIELAHRHGALVLLDGAQSVSHMHVDVQALDCDFFVFSGHKVFAPTGIGAVYGKKKILEAMPPWQGGGNMIADVTFERTQFQGPPNRFEAGTGNIADAIGLGAALDWLTRVGVENVDRYEHELLAYGTERLKTVPGLTLIGTAPEKAGVLSFILAGKKTEEIGGILDRDGIAVRSGHHCAQPILRRFGLEATVRASLAPYNTNEDIDALVDALCKLQTGVPR